MKDSETLQEYLYYQKDEEQLTNLFYILSYYLEQLHQRDFEVLSLNSNTILIKNNFPIFSSITRKTIGQNIPERNILALAQLMLGAYLTIQIGFDDYTKFPVEYIIQNYDKIENAIQNEHFENDYFKDIFINGKREYYHRYLEQKQNQASEFGSANGNVRSYQKSKALPNGIGKMYVIETKEDKMSAFINVIFYPTLLLVVTIVLVISYHIYLFLQ